MSDSLTRGVGRTILALLVIVALLVFSPIIGLAVAVLLIAGGWAQEVAVPWVIAAFGPEKPPVQREFPFDDIVEQPGR